MRKGSAAEVARRRRAGARWIDARGARRRGRRRLLRVDGRGGGRGAGPGGARRPAGARPDGRPTSRSTRGARSRRSPASTPSTSPAAGRRAAAAVPLAGAPQFLLLFDLAFSDPKAVVKAREAARDLVLKGLRPADLVAVATYSAAHGPQLLLGFTSDRRQVDAALDALGAVPTRPAGRSAAAGAQPQRRRPPASASRRPLRRGRRRDPARTPS